MVLRLTGRRRNNIIRRSTSIEDPPFDVPSSRAADHHPEVQGVPTMFRRLSMAVVALLIAAPLAAQAPAGLMMRVDRSTDASDPDDNPEVKLAPVQSGFRVTTGPAAVIYNPQNTATGEYTVSATFTIEQMTPPQANGNPHNNFVGLVFAGRDLNRATQNYIYFMVDFQGQFLIKHRLRDSANRQDDAAAIPTLVPATRHEAIRAVDASGRSENTLEVRVRASDIQFVANGTVVHTLPKTGEIANTDGIYGVRVNHVMPATVVTNLRKTLGRLVATAQD
jgi:hypothetical protein